MYFQNASSVVSTYSRAGLSLRGRTSGTCHDRDEACRHEGERQKPATKDKYCMVPLPSSPCSHQSHRKQNGGCQGLRGGGMRKMWFNARTASSARAEGLGDWLHDHVNGFTYHQWLLCPYGVHTAYGPKRPKYGPSGPLHTSLLTLTK